MVLGFWRKRISEPNSTRTRDIAVLNVDGLYIRRSSGPARNRVSSNSHVASEHYRVGHMHCFASHGDQTLIATNAKARGTMNFKKLGLVTAVSAALGPGIVGEAQADAFAESLININNFVLTTGGVTL